MDTGKSNGECYQDNQASCPTNQARRAKPHAGQAREELIAYLLIAPWVIGFLIFTAGALIFSFGLSFFKTDLLSPAQFVGFGNYQRILSIVIG